MGEYVVRRVRNKPDFFKDGKVTSSVFKDSKGVSIDKSNRRSIGVIIDDEERLHRENNIEKEKDEQYRLKAIVSVDEQLCGERAVEIHDDPVENNLHHAILRQSEEKIRLTQGQAKALANGAIFIKQYNVE